MIDLLKYFDRAICINLDRRADRWREACEEFDKWEIAGVERISAVDGNMIPSHHTLTNGAHGLFHTHIAVIKDAKERGLKSVLFLEDDVCFREQILNIDAYMKSVPEDWVMLYLGGHHIQKPVRENDKIVRNVQVFTTHSFAISHKIFDRVLNDLSDLNNLNFQVDLYYSEVIQKTMPTYSFYPNATSQRPSHSDIENRYTDYNDNMHENLNIY